MISFEEIQAAYYMVAATGVLVAAAYYIQNIRVTIKTREVQMFMQIFERFREKDFWEGVNSTREEEFHELIERTGQEMTFDEYNRLNAMCAYFEGIGVLLKRNYIGVDLVNDFMPITVLSYFENIKPFIKWRIERSGSTYRWKNYQYLYRVVKYTHMNRLKSYDAYLMDEKEGEKVSERDY